MTLTSAWVSAANATLTNLNSHSEPTLVGYGLGEYFNLLYVLTWAMLLISIAVIPFLTIYARYDALAGGMVYFIN